MQRDVQLQALRAAARVAFSTLSLASIAVSFSTVSCGGVTSDPAPPTGGTNGTATPGTEPPSGTATGTSDPNKTPSQNPTREPAPTPTTPPTTPTTPSKTCEKVIADAFPTEGQYPGVKQNVSADVTSCCEKSLLESQGTAPHRWDCCANVDQSKDQKIAMACTPWGPPVPPRMARGIKGLRLVA
jgi:hypothetical protein